MAAVAGSYTAETLVTSVRRRGQFPAADDGSSFPRDTDILAIVNEEMAGYLAPMVNGMRGGQFITHVDIALSANVATYQVPPRAMFADVSTVQLVDPNGYPLAPPLVQMDLEQASKWPSYSLGQPMGYYFEADSITLVPGSVGVGYSLRVYYPQRVSQLVPATQTLAVTSFPGGAASGFFRVGFSASVPSTFLTTSSYEAVSQNPSFQIFSLGVPHAVTGAYYEFAGTQPTNMAVGDTLVLQDTSNVLTGFPADLLGLVAQWTVVKLAEIRGDTEALQRADGAYEREEVRAKAMLGKRVQLGRRKISSAASRTGMRLPYYVK